ncbi:MAG: hypothetical protein IJU26_07505 [Synergistaceae bacterium]|nr:hypothetical protein [Synergistaceae bacterium]
MPLPLLAWAAIGVTGLFGAGKTIGAISDNSKASDINKEANSIVEKAKKRITSCKDASGKSLQALGAKKAYVLDGEIKRFLDLFTLLQNVDFRDIPGLEDFAKFRIDAQDLKGLRDMSDFAGSLVGGTVTGAAAGALTAFGAYSGVMALGTASTGTAIATLSGAAATNATLAFLGGGSLAAGGLGMAGGMAVLGGLVSAPALAVLGLFMGLSASKNLDNAKSNKAKARQFSEEMETAAVLCNGIRRRAYMFERLLIRLDSHLHTANTSLRSAISTYGTDYRYFSQEAKKTTAATASLAKAVKTILDTPILTDDGKLTSESLIAANTVRAALPA